MADQDRAGISGAEAQVKSQAARELLSVVEKAGQEALGEIAAVDRAADLANVRVKYLGRKGSISLALRGLGKIPGDERPVVGHAANQARRAVEQALTDRETSLAETEREQRWHEEAIDVTLPGRPPLVGGHHPLTIVQEQLEDIFLSMGYAVARGPEVEYDYYNFEALNIPRDHPARDMQDSFYITDQVLLRTHTSPVQIRYMQARAPQLPVRVIVPGRVYRRDDDSTHSPMFHQIEGLLVDRHVSMSDLKGTLLTFARELYGSETKIRLRPSYFPFTEPSAEVDVLCTVCGGGGCRTCGGSGWMEVLGCGMVHPQVLRNGGYDPEEVSGFAFGMGLERITMLKYGIDDIRMLFQNDLRFLRQFD